ncbi:MAG: hypothetical protein OXF89_05030 [Rhodospirillaceae bacterium]|nr:hypothetical protein [Rhodospirillaceae bacterium]MCY4067484.1 hypothetical protein [Rhodospirillaceae bacterium]
MGDATAEWEWDAFSAAALEAYRAARREEAVHLWRRAGALAQNFPAGDPRRAASDNNAALALLIDQDHEGAAAALTAALGAWDAALDWTGGMAVSPVARSSLFHQRLEQRHVETYGDVRRARHHAFLTGAVALTRFNLGIARLFLDEDEAAGRLLETALEERERAFGPNNPEVAEIARVLSASADAAGDDARMARFDDKIRAVAENRATDVLDAWRKEQPHEMTDTRRLLAATYLTAIVHERDFL